MKEKNLIGQIRDAVKKGHAKEPFKSKDFSFLNKSKSYISKHAEGNGNYSEYFVRVGIGLYKLK